MVRERKSSIVELHMHIHMHIHTYLLLYTYHPYVPKQGLARAPGKYFTLSPTVHFLKFRWVKLSYGAVEAVLGKAMKGGSLP